MLSELEKVVLRHDREKIESLFENAIRDNHVEKFKFLLEDPEINYEVPYNRLIDACNQAIFFQNKELLDYYLTSPLFNNQVKIQPLFEMTTQGYIGQDALFLMKNYELEYTDKILSSLNSLVSTPEIKKFVDLMALNKTLNISLDNKQIGITKVKI